MANLVIHSSWTGRNDISLFERTFRHLGLLVRARRMDRARFAAVRLARGEMRDPRWFADIGLDAGRPGHLDWIGEMARAVSGRP